MRTRLEAEAQSDLRGRPRVDRDPRLFEEPRGPFDSPNLLIPEASDSPPRVFIGFQERLLFGTLALLWRHRVLAVCTVLLAAAAGFATTRMRTPYYIAHATILPPTEGALGGLPFGGAVGLLGSLGLGSNGTTQFSLYETFTFSRSVISELLRLPLDDAGFPGNLLDYLNIEDPDPERQLDAAIDVVRQRLTFEADKKTGVVSIGFRDVSPRISAAVVNRVVETIDRFDVRTVTRRASDKREFIEKRLAEASRALAKAEGNLEDFKQQNLRIGNAPALILEQARLERELQIEQEVYLTLRKEYELTRIEEERSVPVVNVLDHAVPPVAPAGPSVIKLTAAAGILGMAMIIGLFALIAVKPRQTLEDLLLVARLR